MVDLGGEGEVKFSGGEGFLAGVPPDGFVAGSAVGEPHFDVLFISAHAEVGALVGEVAGDKLDGGIALAGGFEAVEDGEGIESYFFEADFGVEAEGRVKVIGLEMLAGESVEARAKGFKIAGRNGKAGG